MVTADRTVLAVDPAGSFADDLGVALGAASENVGLDVVSDVAEAVERLDDAAYDAVVVQSQRFDERDFADLSAIRERCPERPVVAIVDGDPESVRRAFAHGATDYVRREWLDDDDDASLLAARVLVHVLDGQEVNPDLRFRAYIQYSSDVVSELDEDGTILYQGPSFPRIFGYGQTELVGDRALNYVHPDDRERVAEALERVYATPSEPLTESYRFRHADGSWRYVESVGVNRLEDSGVGTVIVNTRDVTDYRRREQVLEGLHDAATDIESADTVEAVCEETVAAAERILEFDICVINVEEDGYLPIVAISESTPPDGADVMSVDEGLVGRTYRTGEPLLVRDVSAHPDANPQGPYESALSVPIGDHGVFQTVSYDEDAFDEQDLEFAELLVSHTAQALTRVQNESSLRERERELRRQNDRLERFASVVSHDLRNPMSVASGRLELARRTCESEHLDSVADSIERMEDLVDDVLTLAREGNIVDDPSVVSLADAASAAWGAVESGSATLEVTDDVGTVRADESRLHRLFTNLFANAVEHAGNDVTVTVGSLSDGFYVADDGPGIPESERESVFEVGYSTADAGTGLGLNIVREIADAHGWQTAVTDRRSDGASIEFTGVEFTGVER